MSFVEIKHLNTKLGAFELKDINMNIEKGEFLSVIGRSGSGKTVLLESIAGFHNTEGEIWLDGINIAKLPPQKRAIGMVYQDYMLFDNMNVKKNILYSLFFHKNENSKKMFDEVVSFLGISNILQRSVKNLSGGEKQKVAIARALLSNPKLLLLDEPLNAVDLTFKLSFMEFLKALHKRYGLTVLYVTHNFKEAMFFSDRSIVLLEGTIHQNSPTYELFEHPNSKKVAEFLGFKNILPSKLINLKQHNFFSVKPQDITISDKVPNKEFTFKVELDNVFKIQNHYRIKVSLNDCTVSINSAKADCLESKNLYIGFDKKDIQEFD